MSTPDFVWRLYYEDATTFSDSDGEPWESPAWGCVAVAQPRLNGHDKIMVKADYLLWRADWGLWEQCGKDGLDDHIVHFGHLIQCVRKTRWIPTELPEDVKLTYTGLDWHEVWKRARRDCGLKE